jgi:hypothetical protein
LDWLEGYQTPDTSASLTVFAGPTGSSAYVNNWVYINFDNCPARVITGAYGQAWSQHAIYYVSSNGDTGGTYIGGGGWSGLLHSGWVRIYAAVGSSGSGAQSSTELSYQVRKYKRYTAYGGSSGQSWDSPGGPILVTNWPAAATVEGRNGYTHMAYVSGGGVYYGRSFDGGLSWKYVKIVSSTSPANPTILLDASNNCYVAWEDLRDGNREIYFQKIPLNFAPVNGTPTLRAALSLAEKIQSSGSLEVIAPRGQVNVKTLRPTFEWYGLTGIKKYKLLCTKTGAPSRELAKTFTSGEVAAFRPALTYAIHEFDSGLECSLTSADFWSWTVMAYSDNDELVAESAPAEFLVMPDLKISGITNYPNPFNPVQRATKIRYRLSAAATEVKIKIFDLAGRLVRELDGIGQAESSSIWEKYNDVEWDGKNGFGETVLNGIYPFEVIARTGGLTVTGRGKIAVLK